MSRAGDSSGIARWPEFVGQVCLLAPCHPAAGLRARLDVGERLVLQCGVCGWPVLVLALRTPAGDRGGPA